MFTGIVQGTGLIRAIDRPAPDFRRFTVELPEHLAGGLETGASVAHNGCCLTVTRVSGCLAEFDLMAETLAKTNLGSLKAGDCVNLERAARFGDEIIRIDENGLNRTLWFRLPEKLKPYLFAKGFVGLDGCSLTVGSVSDEAFSVHLIPETLERTLFGSRRAGDAVNLEIDAQTQAVVDTVARVMAQKGFQAA